MGRRIRLLTIAALALVGTMDALCSSSALGQAAQTVPAQAAQTDAGGSDVQAITLMQQMVGALGGPKWLAIHDVLEEGRTSGFFQGKPTGEVADFRLLRTVPTSASDPGLLRSDFTKHHDVVNILTKDVDWEITYRGKRELRPDEYLTVFRRRDHSVDEAVRVWWHQPGTVLIYGGQKMAERHLIDEITLLNTNNDNITLQLDADTHLPARVSFSWRDPLYKDKNEDAEEFADYHLVEGIPTPLNETFYHNGDMTSQRYVMHVGYNLPVSPDAFDPDATAAKLVKK